jgi:TrmH family RNA methyltransferase
MITVKKLYTLKRGTRLRKIIRILEEWERALLDLQLPAPSYLAGLIEKMQEDSDLSGEVCSAVRHLGSCVDLNNTEQVRRLVNALRHALLSQLEISQADWDFIHPGDHQTMDRGKYFEGVVLYLDEIRSPFNVGSIFRTAESLGVEEILLSPGTADPLHPRSKRTSMGCVERIDWKRLDYSSLAERETEFFALELGGSSVHSFPYPKRGVLILGSEEVGVSPECLSLADRSLGRTTIPLYGWKGSLNVSVAFGIGMNHWADSLKI